MEFGMFYVCLIGVRATFSLLHVGVCMGWIREVIGNTSSNGRPLCDINSVNVVMTGLPNGSAGMSLKQAALEHEAQRFSDMAATPESESLIGIFEGSTALKKNRFGKPARKVGLGWFTHAAPRAACHSIVSKTLTSRGQ